MAIAVREMKTSNFCTRAITVSSVHRQICMGLGDIDGLYLSETQTIEIFLCYACALHAPCISGGGVQVAFRNLWRVELEVCAPEAIISRVRP